MNTRPTYFKLAWLIAILSLITTGFVNAQDWYHSDWQYRSQLNITNAGASTLSDFQVLVDLDSSFDFTKANSDGSDLRITDADGTTLIPFWIESWDDIGQEANIWVKVPSVPTTGATIYLYYGNMLAESSSNGYSTFLFFDDFSDKQGNWIRYLTWTGSGWSGYAAHYWKYSSIMQEGALQFAIARDANSWAIESLDEEIEMEFDYLHSNVNTNGTINGLSSSSQYEYGVILSGLALGYLYFENIDASLAQRCYDDMSKVYSYVKSQWTTPTNANNYSMTLRGYANAWKAFDAYGNTTSATEVETIIVNYVSNFITNQGTNGYWNTGSSGVQTQFKRNFAVLLAYDVTSTSSYLDAVKDNIDWILANRWVSANGGLTWSSSSPDEFYECHQMWFMVATRMLYDRSGGTYDYLTESQQAWYFLTDNNYANIDMYVHNYDNYNAFFSYRDVKPNGTYQTTNNWKGSYEIGVALWGMSQNYSWVSNYQSTHSSQAYNYLDELAKQCKKTPVNKGFLGEDAASVNPSRWTAVGGPSVSIVEDNGNRVVSLKSSTSHNSLITTNDNSFDDFIFETNVKMTADGNSLCNPEIDFRYTDTNNRYLTILRGETINDLYFRRYQSGSTYINTGYAFNYTANIYYNYKIIANGSNITLYLDDYMLTNYPDAGTGILSGGFSLHNYRNNYAAYFDDVRVRSYANPEPTATLGAEQSLKYLDLKVFLEGPFNETDMGTLLNPSTLPLNQPYNIAPWNYDGTESVASIPNSDIVDWILIEFRDAPDAASATTATIIERQAAFLKNDGSVVGLDGFSILSFNHLIIHSLFVVIRHRNHTDIISANPLTNVGEIYTYDFTTSIDQVYGGAAGFKSIAPGVFGMASGDSDADGTIDIDDKTMWELYGGAMGYLQPDLNFDGQVNNPDKDDVWIINNNSVTSQIP